MMKKLKLPIAIVFYSVLLFMYLYNVSLLSWTGVTTTRIAILVLAVLVILKKNSLLGLFRFYKKERSFFLLFAPVLIVSFVHYLFGYGDSTQFARSFYFFLYVLAMSPVVAIVIGDKTKFLYAVFIAGILQAFFVYIHFVGPEYREWLTTVVRETGNVPLDSPLRSAGYSNGASSALSVVVSLSVFSGLVLYTDTKGVFIKLSLLVGAVFIMSSTILIGRLGLILSIYFFVTILFLDFWRLKNIFLLFLMSLIFVFLLAPFLYEFLMLNTKFETRVIGWAFSFLSNDDVTIENLKGMHIPPLTFNNILFGNGLVRLPNGENASGSDVGYIQTYFAMGLVMAFYFYMYVVLYIFKNLLKVGSKFMPFVLIVPLMFIEIKEPFIFKYMYPFFVLVFLYLSVRNNEKQIN